MHRTKAINEAEQQYEPLSQQVYDELMKEIDKLFDALKNDLIQISGLQWEWQKIAIKYGKTLNEGVVPIPLFAMVQSKKLFNELRYALRESAGGVIKTNQVIELYRDKLKKLVKDNIFRPKSLTPDEVYKQNQKWRQNPALQQSLKTFLADTGNELSHSVLAQERAKLAQERKDFEALQRGTGGPKADPSVDPALTGTKPPGTPASPNPPAAPKTDASAPPATPPTTPNDATANPPTPPKTDAANPPKTDAPRQADPMATSSPDVMDPKERLRVIKIGLLVNLAMRKYPGQQITPEQVKEELKLNSSSGKLEDMDIGHYEGDEAKKEKFLKLGQGYLALHGGGAVGDLDTGKQPYEPTPQAEMTVDQLVTMTTKNLVGYLTTVAGADAVADVKKEFRGGVPKSPEKRKIFIEKVLARKPKKESVEPISIVKQLRLNLRNGVRPRIRLEGVENKVEYIKSLLRK